jgi:hypothetical protein
MTDETRDPATVGHEQHAGGPVTGDEFAEPSHDPTPGGEHPAGGFTPREGTREDGGWTPDEFPHGTPDPGPSLQEDPGARGPKARSGLPRREEPVPPEIEDPEFRTSRADDGDPDRA